MSTPSAQLLTKQTSKKTLSNPSKLLSISQAAKVLGVNPMTLRRWEAKGLLKTPRTIGGKRRYSIKALALLKQPSPKPETSNLFSISYAARKLGISEQTLRRWETLGLCTPQRTSGGKRRYSRKDIEHIQKKILSLPRNLRSVAQGKIPAILVKNDIIIHPAPKLNPINDYLDEVIEGNRSITNNNYQSRSSSRLIPYIFLMTILLFLFSLSYLGTTFSRLSPQTKKQTLSQVGNLAHTKVLAAATLPSQFTIRIQSLFKELATFEKGINVTGDTALDGDLSVTGTSTLAALRASNTTITGDVAINGGDLTSTATTFNLLATSNTIGIGASSGTTTINNDLKVAGKINGSGALEISGESTLKGKATISGKVKGESDAEFTGKLTVGGAAAITGATTISSDLTVTGTTNDIAGTLNLSGNKLNSSGDLTITPTGGQVLLSDGSTLIIGGATAVVYNVIGDNTTTASSNVNSDDDLYIEGNLEVDGTLYANIAGSVTTGFSEGSVVFANSAGALAEDNANFFWNDTTNRLGLGDATPDDSLDIESSTLGYNFLFGSSGITLSNSGTSGINVDTFGQLSLSGGQGAASAIEIIANQGGIDLSTGSSTADIDILSGDDINLLAAGGSINLSTATAATNRQGVAIDSSGNIVMYGGSLTAAKINKVVAVDGTTYAQTCAGINAAIDALGSSGGEIYLPEATYTCTETITIDYNNTTLRGAGKGTIIQPAAWGSWTTPGNVITTGTTDYLTFRDFQIDGTNLTGQTYDLLDFPNGSTYIVIDGMYIKNSDRYGIYINPGGAYVMITNSIIEGSDSYGIYADWTSVYTNISNNIIRTNDYGINIGGDHVDISNNIITGNTTGGVQSTGWGEEATITGNTFFSNGTYGVIVTGTGFDTNNNVTISGNEFKTHTNGVYLNNARQVAVVGNNIIQYSTSAGQYGVYITGASADPADKNLISSNVITGYTDAGDVGIYLANSNVTNNILSYNSFSTNETDITDNGVNTQITNANNGNLGIGDATPDDALDIDNSKLGYNFLFGSNGITFSTSGTSGFNLDTYGQLSLSGGQGAANAIEIIANAGGIDLSTGSGTGDIDILSGDAINLKSVSGTISLSSGTQTTGSGLQIDTNGYVRANRLQAHDSAGLALYEDGGNGIFILDGGNVGIGTTSPTIGMLQIVGTDATATRLDIEGSNLTTGEAIRVAPSYQNISTNTTVVDSAPTLNPSSANTRTFSALYGSPRGSGTSNKGSLIGVHGDPQNLSTSGTLSNLIGGKFIIQNTGAGTTTNGYGIQINTPTISAGSIDSVYGLYIDNQTGGLSNNYSIYSNGGTSYFSGNIGINDSTPDDLLDIENATLGYNFLFGSGGITFSTSGTSGINVDTFGALSLTTNQGAANALELISNAGGIDLSTGSGTGDIDILSGDGLNLKAIGSDLTLSAGSPTYASGLVVDSSNGYVGIGEAAPAAMLDIATGNIRVDNSYGIQFGDSTTAISGNGSTDSILIATNNSYRFAIDSVGEIGIGDTTPDDLLDVEDANLGYNFLFGSGGITFSTATSDNILMKSAGTISLSGGTSTNASGITVTTAGKVGVGQASPTYMFELGEDSAGKPTSNTWTVVSDERLKENIQGFGDGLDVIKQINTISYELNGQAGTPKGAKGIGVIAQQVKDIIPYTIKTFLSGGEEYFSFDSSPLTFVLINAVKELDNKVRPLETINELLSDVSTLKSNYSQLSKDLALLKESSSSSSLYTAYSIPYTDASASAVLGASGINGDLTVTDQTYLNELSVSGLTTIGTLVIDPLDSSINSLSNPLKIQSLSLQPINFQGTKVTIAQNGDLEIKQGRLILNDRIRGQIKVPPGQTQIHFKVPNLDTWESTPSSIQVTPSWLTPVAAQDLTDQGFTVTLEKTPTTEQILYWLAVW